MASIRVSDKQNILDVAIERLGSVESAFKLAMKNSLSITDELLPGQSLELTDVANGDVANYFSDKGIVPATALSENDVVNGGINYMGIEIDFIVS